MFKYLISFIVLLQLILSSCSPMGAIVTTTSAGAVVAEGDRTVGEAVDDTAIKIKIAEKFAKSKSGIFLDVDTTVRVGTVLLTGIVDSQEIRIETVKLVWEVSGVKEVINEIDVGDKQNIKQYTSDLWISSQVRAKTLANLGFSALTYNFETINGEVHIMGVAPNSNESESVIGVIKKIKGVKKISNHIIIKEAQ